MKTVNVGIIGFGTVGRGVVKILLSKKKLLKQRSGLSINLVKIADKNLRQRKGMRVPGKLLTKNIDSILKDRNIDIVVELIGGIHPAKEIILKAITLGKHVVTANKALLAEDGEKIFMAASRFRTLLGFEASVGGGIPVINVLRNSFIANDIEVIYGILNGTSNFILSKMSDECCSFRQALADAKARGIAERNPKLDISGVDSCHKIAILVRLGFGLNIKLKDIHTEGIEELDPVDIQYAKNWGYAVKLLAIARKSGQKLDVRVHPTLISLKNILANVKFEDNAIFIKGDMAGGSLLYGKGAGSLPAASSVVSDIVEIAKGISDFKKAKDFFRSDFDTGIKRAREISELFTRYYLRFSAIDKPGVLAGISSILARNKISIATVTQKEKKAGQPVPIVMLTHQANEGKLNKALEEIDKLNFITKKTVKLRIMR
ncbi:MAG: homoserine dehydrogenase [Candidatus Omnitrophota bacterium]|nr:MAG: homoserine dehydrogenase [Candidatus Omnitrophota bacterium]